MRLARFWMLSGVGLFCACGSDTITIEPIVTCEPGPVFSTSVVECELTSEGEGGPKAVRLWVLEANDGMFRANVLLAPDGRVHLLGESQTRDAVIVAQFGAQFGADLSFEWSRRLVHAEQPDGQLRAEVSAAATSSDGLDVATRLLTAALTHIDADGTCSSPTPLEFGGDPHAYPRSILREDDRLILTGDIGQYGSSRGFVQRRELDGELVSEVEVLDSLFEDVGGVRVQPGTTARYLVTYSGYSPYGIWSNYDAARSFDDSLTSIDNYPRGPYELGFLRDAQGRLYTWSREPWDPIVGGWQPPSTLYVRRMATLEQPAGDTIELSIPQPMCGDPKLVLFDESRQVVLCSPWESPSMLLGFEGSGPPSWTSTLSCPGTAELSLLHGQFLPDGRLWIYAHEGGLARVVIADF